MFVCDQHGQIEGHLIKEAIVRRVNTKDPTKQAAIISKICPKCSADLRWVEVKKKSSITNEAQGI